MKKINPFDGLVTAAILSLFFLPAAQVSAHEHHPPHHGTLVELGEEFAHVELLLDSSTGELDAFVLDGEAEDPVRISQPSIQIKVKGKGGSYVMKLVPIADALTGEVVGNTSEYRGISKKLKGVNKFKGTIAYIKAKGEAFKNVWFLYPEGNEGVKPSDHSEK